MPRGHKALFAFGNPNRRKEHDTVTWTPRDPGNGNTYAVDGTTGEPIRSTWPRCGHTCRECWPEDETTVAAAS